jgi:single-strand DNA-binding protein
MAQSANRRPERGINQVTLLGRLGQDAETTFTPSGVAVTKFGVGTSRAWKDKRTEEWQSETQWTNCVLWQHENLGEYLKKGARVHVTGRLQTRKYEDREGNTRYATEVVVDDVIIVAFAQADAPASRQRTPAPPTHAQNGETEWVDVPF